jgi:(1->4)-alpha-D-glucan 1-alpha-D-glucosylmutase
VREWAKITAPAKTVVDGDTMPDANDEYLFYQALLGACSFAPGAAREELVERMRAYMTKAMKEAKLRTSWVTPNEEYERAVDHFVQETINGKAAPVFWASFEPFARQIAKWGAINSLSQVALKLTSPGVPDFYQGTEWWDLSLVDPDNRRPVDYGQRDQALNTMEPLLSVTQNGADQKAAATRAMLDTWPDGKIKMLLTAAGLRLRGRYPDLFLRGDYVPCAADGEKSDHCVAFMRQKDKDALLVVVPRFPSRLSEGFPLGVETWKDTRILLSSGYEQAIFRNIVTGERFRAEQRDTSVHLLVGQLFQSCPVAILMREDGFIAKGLSKDFCE